MVCKEMTLKRTHARLRYPLQQSTGRIRFEQLENPLINPNGLKILNISKPSVHKGLCVQYTVQLFEALTAKVVWSSSDLIDAQNVDLRHITRPTNDQF